MPIRLKRCGRISGAALVWNLASAKHVTSSEMARRSLAWLAICIASSLHVCGQPDSRSLRSSFGRPVKRFKNPPKEVFVVLPGVVLAATYSPDHQLCTLEIARGVANKQQIDEVLEKAVLSADRGKKWNEFQRWVGIGGFENRYYEKVIITEDMFTSPVINKNPGLKVLFKKQTCGWKRGTDIFDVPPSTEPPSVRQ